MASVASNDIVLSPGPIASVIAWGIADVSTIVALGDTLLPAVKVIDKVGNGIAGVRVTWSHDTLSSLANTDMKTDPNGVAAPGLWITLVIPGVTKVVIVATPTPSNIENSPLSLVANVVP